MSLVEGFGISVRLIIVTRFICWALFIGFLGGCSSQSSKPSDLPVFTPLGDLRGGEFSSEASGVSDDGTVVIGQSKSAQSGSETEAFRWTPAEGMIGLGTLPGGVYRSQSFDVSSDGSVIVGNASSKATPTEAFRWTRNTGMIRIGDLPGGTFTCSALNVSADGRVVVGWGMSDRGFEATKWISADGPDELGDLPGGEFRSAATLVSTDGTLIVGYGHSEQGTELVRWSQDGRIESLGDLPGGDVSCEPFGISFFGLAIVGQGYSSQGQEAFLWTSAKGMSGLGDLPSGSFHSVAFDVSNDGTRVVGMGTTRRGEEAFLWEEGTGLRPLSGVLLGLGVTSHQRWILHRATGISGDGTTIVGYGTNPDGKREAWVISNMKLNTAPDEELLAEQSSPATTPSQSFPGSSSSITASDIATAGIQSEIQQVTDTINAWAQAWSAKDVERYLSFYASEFRPPEDQSQPSWERLRRERLTRPRFIKVSLSDLKVEIIDKTTARARFLQNYESDTYINQVIKTFQLKKQYGAWKIRQRYTAPVEEQRAPTPKTTPLPARPPTMGSSPSTPPPPPVFTGPFADPTQMDIQIVSGIVLAWAQAWSAQDVDTYLSFYAPEFSPPQNLTRDSWEKLRRERLSGPRFIQVILSDLRVEMVDNSKARARFVQSYQSDTYGNRSRKSLLLQKQEVGWKIIEERGY